MKNFTIKNKLKQQHIIDVPFHVWSKFHENCKYVYLAGDQASFGLDYANLVELQDAIEWYVNQLGGTVKWED